MNVIPKLEQVPQMPGLGGGGTRQIRAVPRQPTIIKDDEE
jgi:hypothetical protein